jgi:8-amino-7-oxononanoate synthase
LVQEEIFTRNFKFVGATGSRLLSGNSAYVETIEREIAAFHQTESSLIFNSGFDANYGLITSLCRDGHLIVMDEFVHASIHDGARASKAEAQFFRHNDAHHLDEILKASTHKVKYVIIESLYSMDGDVADLAAIVDICEMYDAALIVDEAHATAVFGENGEGLVQRSGLEEKVFARVVTFGKAIGVHGACVLGSESLKNYLINHCRPFIFSTALPFQTLAAIRTAYNFFPKAYQLREQLWANIGYYKNLTEEMNLPFKVSESQIQNFIIAGNKQVVDVAEKLIEANIDARPIRFPTVARGQERIRICLHNFNTKEEIKLLFDTVKKIA